MTLPDPHLIWNTALDELRSSLPHATYDSWLARTHAVSLDDDTITVSTPDHYTHDWLTHRLMRPILRALHNTTGHPLGVTFTVLPTPTPAPPPLSPQHSALQEEDAEQLTLEGDRLDTYAAIVRPDRVFVGTQYFRRYWWPRLGPTLSMIIMDLRQRCYYNRHTGEKRDTCSVTYQQIADSIGVHRTTVHRHLLRPDAGRFILDTRTQYRYDPALGRTVQRPTVWRIRLDEPYIPADDPPPPPHPNDT